MVYLAVPMGTTSLSEGKLPPLVWPRNGVGVRTVLELAVAAVNIAAYASSCCVCLKRERESVCVYNGS